MNGKLMLNNNDLKYLRWAAVAEIWSPVCRTFQQICSRAEVRGFAKEEFRSAFKDSDFPWGKGRSAGTCELLNKCLSFLKTSMFVSWLTLCHRNVSFIGGLCILNCLQFPKYPKVSLLTYECILQDTPGLGFVLSDVHKHASFWKLV